MLVLILMERKISLENSWGSNCPVMIFNFFPLDLPTLVLFFTTCQTDFCCFQKETFNLWLNGWLGMGYVFIASCCTWDFVPPKYFSEMQLCSRVKKEEMMLFQGNQVHKILKTGLTPHSVVYVIQIMRSWLHSRAFMCLLISGMFTSSWNAIHQICKSVLSTDEKALLYVQVSTFLAQGSVCCYSQRASWRHEVCGWRLVRTLCTVTLHCL